MLPRLWKVWRSTARRDPEQVAWAQRDGAAAGSLGVSVGEGEGWRFQVSTFRGRLVVSRPRNYVGEEKES